MNNTFDKLIIFELANNHQGKVDHARYIIEELAKVANKYRLNAAVKFQYRDLDSFVHPDYKDRTDVKHIPRFMSTRMDADVFYSLVRLVKDSCMKAMCTPFDEKSADLCIDHGIDILKVASCSATDWPLLEKIASLGKPVVASVGGQSFTQIDNIYNFYVHRNVQFALLHCVGLYPPQPSDLQLNCINKMINRYPNVPVGYSGHEDPKQYVVSQMALAKGAQIFERHIGHAAEGISLNAYSTEVDNVSGWIEALNTAYEMCGSGDGKYISDAESAALAELARGVFLKRAIKAGECLNRDDVFFAMPATKRQTKSGEFQPGMATSKDYAAKEALFETPLVSTIKDTRSILHDVKGLLYEAKIVLGNQFKLELSHHYGLQHFRHYGATIINIVNREYCKKIIVIMPGQVHPMHYHKVKEETFQVLYGTLQLTADGKDFCLNAGDIFTIERNVHHAFKADDGCIFEEISTTHVKNDSYYDDLKIAALDLIERKTFMEDW
jgi:N-acetylneuraminate synthase